MNKKQNINIIGAGLVGALQAIYLLRKGYKVSIYERRSDMRKASMSAGRSINLALSDRGFKALEGVGIADAIREIGIPMHGRVMHDIEGNLTFQPYGKEGQSIYSVSRGGLNCRLMDLAEKEGAEIHFEHKCVSVNLDEGSAIFNFNGKDVKIQGDLLIGADGAFSEVRGEMMKTPRFNYSQYYIDHGYKELSIPPNADGSLRMEKNALHIWPRGEFMLIALPNTDGTFTCTLFFPMEGERSFETINTAEKGEAFFKEMFPDALAMMDDFHKEFDENPNSSMVITKCFPWTWKDKVMLMGDAAHAIVPFYGQGMNAGFEDCTVFNELLEAGEDSWTSLLKKYETSRKPNGDAIAQLALNNFIEMRDLVGDPKFLLQKKIEARFSQKYPQKWVPLYSMVTFSHTPYNDALLNGEHQESIMRKVMAMPDIESKWDSEEVENLILSHLQ
ncbi:MAG: NAD(P)/FAD-dependent oxidoreductase [Bacteroidia bacterium]